MRMLGLFQTILSRLSATETRRGSIGDLDLLSLDDKVVLREWNKSPGPLVERHIHDVIAEQITRPGASDATAVVGWDATFSNGELDAFSTALAYKLRSQGIGNGKRSKFVPFCFEKSAVAVVVILAVLKAGAAFVPLDPAHPVSRLRKIAEDCSPDVILCSPKYEGLCSEIIEKALPVDTSMLKRLENEAQADASAGVNTDGA